IVEIAGDDRALGADDHARGLETDLETMSAIVALGGGLGGGIDVERVVGAGLHARFAADAALAVEVHDAVRPSVERDGRTDRDARRVVAVITSEDREVPPRVRERPSLHVLHPRPERTQRNLVLLLARHRAGVTADALALIDHESVAHASRPPMGRDPWGRPGPGQPMITEASGPAAGRGQPSSRRIF